MTPKNYRTFYLLLVKIIIFIAVVGTVLLIVAAVEEDNSNLGFSLIAFAISVAALIMTTLQSITITRQARLTQRSATIVHEASERIQELVQADRKIEKEIKQDLELDKKIIAILELHGVGESEEDRQRVAANISTALHHEIREGKSTQS